MNLEIIEAMPRAERVLHFLAEDGKSEQARVNFLSDEIRITSADIKWMKSVAKQAAVWYAETKEDSQLEKLEGYTELIKNMESYKKYLWKQLKETSGRVRWLRSEWITKASGLKRSATRMPSEPSKTSMPNN